MMNTPHCTILVVLLASQFAVAQEISKLELQQSPPLPALDAYDEGALRAHQGPHVEDRGYREALERIEGGRAQTALADLNIAVTSGGRRGDARARVYRGRAMLASAMTASAIIEFNTALRLKPAMPEALYWRGVALRRLGICDEALEHIESGLRGGVKHRDAGALRASILYRLGRFEEALAIREREAASNPEDVEERLYRAEVYAAMGKSAELAKDLQFIYDRAPQRKTSVEASVARIITARKAREAAEKVVDPAAAYATGNRLFWESRYVEAAEWYTHAARLQKDSIDALCGAARSHELASSAFGHAWFAVQAVRRDSRNVEACILRAWAWRNLAALDLAEAEFNRAISLDPNSATAHLGRGRLLYECHPNRTREAQRDFDKAVELAPKNADTWMARGVFLIEHAPAFIATQRLPPDRVFNPPYYDFSRAISLDSRRTRAYVYRAITQAAWGKSGGAKADLNKAFELEPWNAKANLEFARRTLEEMRLATRAGRQLMEDLASGAQGGLPATSSGNGDGSAATRAKWNKDTALDNASKAGDRAAYERIGRDEGTWRDRSRYGG